MTIDTARNVGVNGARSRLFSRVAQGPRIVGLAVAVSMVLATVCEDHSSSAKPLGPDTPVEYLNALEIANSFLSAWVERDQDGGISLMSSRLRNVGPSEGSRVRLHVLRDYMSGISNPHHHAFEISPGHKLTPARYSFHVTLYEYADGDSGGYSFKSDIEVAKEADGWRIDKLPKTSDNP